MSHFSWTSVALWALKNIAIFSLILVVGLIGISLAFGTFDELGGEMVRGFPRLYGLLMIGLLPYLCIVWIAARKASKVTARLVAIVASPFVIPIAVPLFAPVAVPVALATGLALRLEPFVEKPRQGESN